MTTEELNKLSDMLKDFKPDASNKSGIKYKAKLWLNDNQYLAVLSNSLVVVTNDKTGNPIRYAIFGAK